jgi:Fe-S cluster assembly scaffold protein SufB
MNPIALLEGENAKASLTSLLFGQKESKIDIGGNVELIGNNTCAEIHAKAIATDSSALFLRGTIIENNSNSKGHLECRGLMLSDSAKITAIPELIAQKMGAKLSHEAAIGKISQEEITYLMSRGLSEEKANSVIIRGFLDTKILGLPKELEEKIKELIKVKVN